MLTHRCPWGVAVIAGTGSVVICLEVDDTGEVVQIGRRGGTGYLLGDDGSGQSFFVGLRASGPELIGQHSILVDVLSGSRLMTLMRVKRSVGV